ncbi:uncharacterized protein LOC141524765 [Cotesia typhae]|uniref:uncharacterized protein LOC141524765 n=1 Tax=Cotesia typhae TaxID=2053667 RepID=UPI003D69CF2A
MTTYSTLTDRSVQKTSIVLSLLPYLIAPQRSGRKRKSVEGETTEQALPPRLSLDERSQSFFIHIPDMVNLEAVLEAGINHTTRFSLQHQPIPIIVGPFENIAASYVILENLIYEADSILHAFESTFHICYAVNCDYLPNARTVWFFLTASIFKYCSRN